MLQGKERKEIRESALVRTEVEIFSSDFLKNLRQYKNEYEKELESRRKSGNHLSEADVANLQTRLLYKHGLVGSLKIGQS